MPGPVQDDGIDHLGHLKLRKSLSLSFSGCGFLCIYHAGVSAAIKEYAPHLLNNSVSGASAGSIIAACLVSNVCISQATSLFLDVVTQARSHTFGALNRDFDLMDVVKKDLQAVLPENAHELCTGKLRISLTRFCDMKNIIISEFKSKDELIQAIICSCFIPFYGGFVYPKFRGVTYIDGGVTDNQPKCDSNTITVSPFCGENDICPTDSDSASMFDFMFTGTSIRFTMNNLYRFLVCLFPPPAEACSRMCRQGFEDALKYLTRNGLVPCVRCLTVKADIISVPPPAPVNFRRNRSRMNSLTPNNANARPRNFSECESCFELVDPLLKPHAAALFPKIVQKTFDDAQKTENAFFEYLYSFKVMQMANFMVLPFMASFQIIKFCKSLSVWLANKTVNDWFADRTRNLIDLVLSEVEKQKNYYSARLALQYAITELTCPAIINGTPPVRENNSEFDLSDEAQKEYEFLKIKDALPLNANLKLLKQEIPSRIDEEREEDLSLLGDDDQESLNHVINYANKHDAILEYYYMDDNHEMHLCEIFGVDHPEKRHLCHTHLGTNNLLNSSDSTESNCNCNRSLNA